MMRYAPAPHPPHAAHRARIQTMSGLPRLGLRLASARTKRIVCLKQAAGSSVCLTASTVKIATALSSSTASSSAEINSAATGAFPHTGEKLALNCGRIKRSANNRAKERRYPAVLYAFALKLVWFSQLSAEHLTSPLAYAITCGGSA